MGLRTSIGVLVVGLIAALAITLQVQYVDISTAGWCLVIGAVAGLLISAVQRVRRQPYAEWFAIGPWLLIIGLVMTQAVSWPQVTGIDPWMVGLIVLVIGVVVTLVAIYVVSPLRMSQTMRSAWGSDAPPDGVERKQPLAPGYAPPVERTPDYHDRSRGYDDRASYGSGSAYGSSPDHRGHSGDGATSSYGNPDYSGRTTRQSPTGGGSEEGGEPPTQQLPRS